MSVIIPFPARALVGLARRVAHTAYDMGPPKGVPHINRATRNHANSLRKLGIAEERIAVEVEQLDQAIFAIMWDRAEQDKAARSATETEAR